ncbi:putative strictosidine synthase transcription factor WD40-like family [Medicago truncatula]|uniref:Putative strictosidine synthase transcription factor WD40-like family n=1 Tax=Medicago truncatula TaxID=3880 RepID=A0A396GMZ3_MEDTR|nr:protein STRICTOSIDINE SYNTHASE-LIKE 12-like [Medicago truncatula]RHN42410.1 putative strictosidine synthase transcription factor WD40-like family [Medicago truncatula]
MLNMAMVVTTTLVIFILCSQSVAILQKKLQLPSPVTGPESLAFDRNGGGPYVGSSDGRIFKYIGPNEGFKEYAFTSPNRNKTICDGLADFSAVQAKCGRPLGLSFNHQTGDLYVADAYYGLVKVSPDGANVTQLVGPAQANSTKFADGLDVDSDTGIVYFTEASTNFQLKDFQTLITSGDNSGSLLRYDPSTNQTTVLLSNLAVPSGVAVSKDGSFVLVSEYLSNRVQRVWLKGPRANSSELFMLLAGRPDNIKRNSRGQFWISVNSYLGPPGSPRRTMLPGGIKVTENGLILQIVSLGAEYGTQPASEIQEYNETLYSGSLLASYASIFTP